MVENFWIKSESISGFENGIVVIEATPGKGSLPLNDIIIMAAKNARRRDTEYLVRDSPSPNLDP
jgi:hypothetical protein